jgi:PTS system N-acetylglucosamine-specific IIC component
MALNATKSNTHGLPLILAFGAAYFVLYYVVFTVLIRRLNLPTPGREPDTDSQKDTKAPS